MDRLDRITILALVVLLAGMMIVIGQHPREPKPDPGLQERIAAGATPAARAELGARVKVARNLIEGGGIAKAEALAQELKQQFPYQGEAYMLMGDVLMRKQQPVPAMYEYKSAIELNPDYLDKKTPQFQGKKLKVAVGEALAEIDRRLAQRPEDMSLQQEKKVIYYLYRKIAGSCG
jgi:tetratricopeptide (TPR) repeat protein